VLPQPSNRYAQIISVTAARRIGNAVACFRCATNVDRELVFGGLMTLDQPPKNAHRAMFSISEMTNG